MIIPSTAPYHTNVQINVNVIVTYSIKCDSVCNGVDGWVGRVAAKVQAVQAAGARLNNQCSRYPLDY